MKRFRQATSLTLAFLLLVVPASAGLVVRGTQGLTMTGADGIYYESTSGLTMTGADGLGLNANGIYERRADGLTMTGADGQTVTGVDGVTYTGANTYTATRADGLTMTGADGLTMTGADGLTMTGADGTTYQVNSVVVRQPTGLTMTGADGLTMTGADGLTMIGADGLTMTGADGLTMTGADSVTFDNANQVVATRTDGTIFSAPTSGLTMTGADGLAMTGADGIVMTGVEGLTLAGADGMPLTSSTGGVVPGLVSFDPELAVALERATDDRGINAVVIYHRYPTATDFAELQRIGVRGGTRYRSLPMVAITATRDQFDRIGDLPSVRSIYGNRTLQWSADTSRVATGATRVPADSDLSIRNGNTAVTGAGVTVAVLDTGIDGTHADLAGRVVRNVKLADAQGLNLLGFGYPLNLEGLPNTDLVSGHGTFVAGVVAAKSTRTGGKYNGVAPGARLVGMSAGDATLLSVLAGFDYLLGNYTALGVRVLNCSFSANTVYDENDPVNVATRMLTERGVNVVFSAGNTGPGMHTLNPYAGAPWVISVAALDERGRLADFSSRGDFGSRHYRPTLAAPGVNVVSLRATGLSGLLTTIGGLTTGNDTGQLTAAEMPYYVTASGTSFSAPMVAGVIALMLEVNPQLTPAEVRDILQRTATPLPPYYLHEVGAGMLNAHAAVLEAAFPDRQLGLFRATLNRQQVRFVNEGTREFTGTVVPGGASEVGVTIPADAVYASAAIAWGPMWSTNDLVLSVKDPRGVQRGFSNSLNLPGLMGRSEHAVVRTPEPGPWRVSVTNRLGPVGTAQAYSGIFDVARYEIAPLPDLGGLGGAATGDIRYSIRTCTMWPLGGHFRPHDAVTRADMAGAMLIGGRVPQYLPASPRFTDLADTLTMNFVESVQSAPGGPLFPDAQPGGAFRPDERVSRLVAAIVLVRAAGLESEARSGTVTLPSYADVWDIPQQYQGHVAVAVAHDLIRLDGDLFNPVGAYTRADLAHGMTKLSEIFMAGQ